MRKNNERGQSMVLTVVFMVVLLGFAALVVDVGSWYRAHRSAQATADASALAGAAVLPDTARRDGTRDAVRQQERRQRIGRPSGTPQITITQQGYEMDTIKVKVTRPSPGFFARVFGSAVHERDRVRHRDRPRLQRAGHPERHRADHRQLQAPAAELHPRAEPDVQSDVRDAHDSSRSRTSTPPAARTPPAPSG